MEKATFAAGCFWGVEADFRKIKGVVDTKVGYTGGDFKNPSYKDVCSNKTGHAEAIEIKFDPKKISYSKLLDVFWKIHNPSTLNRQGLNFGKQYRSAVFYHNLKQKELALKSKEKLEKSGKKVVTEIVKASKFYTAEDYHQRYLEKRKFAVC